MMRTFPALLAAAVTLLSPAALADAGRPPQGKYRCYQPPDYAVLAWFEITADGVRIDGGDPLRFAFDAKARRIDWPTQDLAPYRHGFFFPSGTAGGDAERTTIVLARQRTAQPGQTGWDRLPRCYLTTH
ncbi:MAG: hypothetical protein HYU78_03010 [Rhodocyclales bacterium]|nr:hypothetical protein [Rhodocyclales bacterium]